MAAAPGDARRELTRLRAELDHAMRGTPWHGNAFTTNLHGVTAADAHAHPIAGAHSIWELVLHVAAWTREGARRLRGAAPEEPAVGDWPPAPPTAREADWVAARAELAAAHDDVLAAIDALDAARLDDPPVQARDPSVTTAVKHRVLVHGLAQHHAYHGGQVALLRRALGPRATASA